MLATSLKRFFLARTTIEAQLYPALELPVRFRTFTPNDYEPCVSIYRQNETGRFPPSVGKKFEAFLRNESQNFIVAGFGGIHTLGPETAVLFYGMVAPELQRKRIGAMLTLLRLTQLPPQTAYFIFIFAVEASMNIYRRFGFIRTTEGWPDDEKKLHPVGVLRISSRTLLKIRSTLARRHVQLNGNLSLQSSAQRFCQIEQTPAGFRFEFGAGNTESRNTPPR